MRKVGPEIKVGQSGTYNALTATFAANDDFMNRSGDRIPDIRLALRPTAFVENEDNEKYQIPR